MASLRGDGMARRIDRLAKLKKGPGVFVYDGGACDTECIPTVKKIGRKEPVLDSTGFPVVDSSGRQIFQPAGQPMRDHSGKPVLGGLPEFRKIPVSSIKIRGLKLVEGVPVNVGNEELALKLRSMTFVRELSQDEINDINEEKESDEEDPTNADPEASEQPKRKAGRPKKVTE